MASPETVFVSYSHDSAEHAERVLALSNRLRSEGIDCVLDQYESSPPEGWPRWMDREIDRAKYVLVICTRNYYSKIMGEVPKERGMGVKWEGSLVYQHLYDSSSGNTKFIPVLLNDGDEAYIPTPLRGSTFYRASSAKGYESLYWRLAGVPEVERPRLGKRRALPKKKVKTNLSVFLSAFIDPEVWDEAGWRAVFYMYSPDTIPALGLGFSNQQAAERIFKNWRKRFGTNDEFEELRVSIIQGPIENADPGYSVHIGSDLDNVGRRYKSLGFEPSEDVLLTISRFHRMDVGPSSPHLEMFKRSYRQSKSYLLVPGVLGKSQNDIEPMMHLGLHKGTIYFRDVSELDVNDVDYPAIGGASLHQSRDPNE